MQDIIQSSTLTVTQVVLVTWTLEDMCSFQSKIIKSNKKAKQDPDNFIKYISPYGSMMQYKSRTETVFLLSGHLRTISLADRTVQVYSRI